MFVKLGLVGIAVGGSTLGDAVAGPIADTISGPIAGPIAEAVGSTTCTIDLFLLIFPKLRREAAQHRGFLSQRLSFRTLPASKIDL